MSEDNWYSAILGTMLGIVLGILVMNAIIPTRMPNTSSNQGFPIHDINISEDGMTLTFFIGSDQWQANMQKAISRPPNLSLAATLFVIGDQIIVLNGEGTNVFGNAITYTDALQILKG